MGPIQKKGNGKKKDVQKDGNGVKNPEPETETITVLHHQGLKGLAVQKAREAVNRALFSSGRKKSAVELVEHHRKEMDIDLLDEALERMLFVHKLHEKENGPLSNDFLDLNPGMVGKVREMLWEVKRRKAKMKKKKLTPEEQSEVNSQLSEAISHHDLEKAKKALDKGADADKYLMRALKVGGGLDIVKAMIEYGGHLHIEELKKISKEELERALFEAVNVLPYHFLAETRSKEVKLFLTKAVNSLPFTFLAEIELPEE